MELVEKFIKDPNDFIENNNVKQLIKLAKYLSTKYYISVSSGPIVSDEEYDLLIDAIYYLEPNNSFFKEIGTDCKQNNIVELPFYMGSMDKIKNSKDVIDWSNKYDGPYYISDKLDGISALLELDKKNGNKLFTRGNGLKGNDISPLLKYLNSPQLDAEYVVVRGELIMSKEKFKKYNDKMANARNLVCGTVNSKKVNKEKMNDIDFVAYEIIEPWKPIKDQFKALKINKFKTVYNTVLDNINIINLSTLLKDRKDNSEYDIDGLIVSYGDPKKRLEKGNPDYAFAFKQTFENQTVNVKVLDVEWNESKNGYLKPRLILEPTKLSGVTIKYVTAFNAKYVQDNNIGPDTIIKLVRSGDVIPHILQVVKSTKAKMPDLDYIWTDTNVDIIANIQSKDGLVQSLTFSVQKLKIKNVNEGIIKKFVENDIKTIIDLLNIDKNFLLDLDSFKEKKANLVFNSIQEAIENMTLLNFMVASNILGRGLGERKIKKILDTYPNIITEHKKDIYNKIIKLEGFDEITTNLFTNNFDEFIKLFKKLPSKLQKQLLIIKEKQNVNNRFKDLKIVFSGFRNKEWEQIIEEEGGKIVDNVSKNTDILIAKKEDIEEKNSSKIKKALKLNIKILTPEKFDKEYFT
jgi:NAD-dependent DNA ligase